MSTIRATNIQPQSDSDPLVFSTNATEKLRIPSTGAISLTGGAVVSGGISVTGGAVVSGSLNIGNFASSNVSPLPSMAVGVGQVVPLFASGNGPPTSFLPAGTWFINIVGHMNVSGDENFVMSGSFTVTVPSGQFFSLAPYNSNSAARNPATTAEQGRSGLIGRFFTSTTNQTTVITSSSSVPTGWTEFTEGGTAPFTAKRYSIGSGISLSAPDATNGHSIVYQLDNTVGWVFVINGYAIRIA
jgi:hypothetical protein